MAKKDFSGVSDDIITKRIIEQNKRMNAKTKQFIKAGFEEERLNTLFKYTSNYEIIEDKNGKKINFNGIKETGGLTTSKAEIEKMSRKQKIDYFNAINKVHTDENRGTVKRYQKEVEKTVNKTNEVIKRLIDAEKEKAIANASPEEKEKVKEKLLKNDNIEYDHATMKELYKRLEENRKQKGVGIGSDVVILEFYLEKEKNLSDEFIDIVKKDIQERQESQILIEEDLVRGGKFRGGNRKNL